MEGFGVYGVTLAGLGYLVWQHWRSRPEVVPVPNCDERLDIVLAVAGHEAEEREQDVGAAHLIYALLQDDSIVAILKKLGGDSDDIENRVFDSLAERPAAKRWAIHYRPEVHDVMASVLEVLENDQRLATLGDLWHGLLSKSPEALETALGERLRPVDVLVELAHDGLCQPESPPACSDVDVVLVNDRYTPMDFVTYVLRNTFQLTESQATQVTLTTHHEGSAVAGTYPLDEAQRKVSESTARARDQGFPLWLRLRAPSP